MGGGGKNREEKLNSHCFHLAKEKMKKAKNEKCEKKENERIFRVSTYRSIVMAELTFAHRIISLPRSLAQRHDTKLWFYCRFR